MLPNNENINLKEAASLMLLQRVTSLLTVGTLIVIFLLAIFSVLIGVPLPVSMLICIAFVLILCAINFFYVCRLDFNLKKNLKNINSWFLYLRLCSFFIGCSFGGTSSFYLSSLDNLDSVIIISLVIILLAFFPILVQQISCYYLFAVPLVIPVIFVLVLFGEVSKIVSAALLFTLLLGILIYANQFFERQKKSDSLKRNLIDQNEKVKEANDSKSQFLASASHDLRQPLQALGFYITILSNYLREPEKKAIFDKTLNAYHALEHLLNQLLNISKLNANLISIVNSTFSVKELFEKLRNDYQLRALDRGLTIEFKSNDHFVFSDAVSVERVMRNLIENALRYTKEGSVKVSCEKMRQQLTFQVEDTGIGISKEHINKVFDEFYQIENPERDRTKGFGLGLYAVNRLAGLLETKINVESELGKGSCFTIALPLGEKPKEKKLAKNNESINDFILVDKVILLVDDDEVVLDSISRLVMSWKCLILAANSYQSAIDLLIQEEIKPEVLVLDYRLPKHKNGVDLVKNICKHFGETIPAIILTGDTGEESLTHINESGLSFIHKPADPQKLKKRLKKLLNNRKD